MLFWGVLLLLFRFSIIFYLLDYSNRSFIINLFIGVLKLLLLLLLMVLLLLEGIFIIILLLFLLITGNFIYFRVMLSFELYMSNLLFSYILSDYC